MESTLNLLAGSTDNHLPVQIVSIISFVGSIAGGILLAPYGGKCFPYGGPECFKPKQYIKPASWAFSIWGFIYAALFLQLGYILLPSSWVPSRNDELIFGDIGYNFALNIFLNVLWL